MALDGRKLFMQLNRGKGELLIAGDDARVADARRLIVKQAPDGAYWPWLEINNYFAQFEDIEGATYNEEKDRLEIWGPKAIGTTSTIAMPPLLFDDFVTALTILEAGQNPGVSIGTENGRVPSEENLRQDIANERYPVEYIPPSTSGTHLGSVLFEVDRCLKGLAHGEDNLTRQPVSVSVPGYLSVAKRLQGDAASEVGKLRPIGLWWFVPDENGVAVEGYSMRFVRYRMRVEYRALANDPAVAAFGEHMSAHFEEFANDLGLFRELVRIHKLVQIARWYEESEFPAEQFRHNYRRLVVNTRPHTRLIRTLVSRQTTPGATRESYFVNESFLIGGINLSPRNQYIAARSLAAPNLAPGVVTHWRPQEMNTVQRVVAPPRYGSFPSGSVPVPLFTAPVLHARPTPESYGWTANLGGRDYAVVSIPTRWPRGLSTTEEHK